jgi:hypothetical protein
VYNLCITFLAEVDQFESNMEDVEGVVCYFLSNDF